MKLSELIRGLQDAMSLHGDIDVQIQDTCPEEIEITLDSGNKMKTKIIDSPNVFAVPEEYDGVMVLNLRSWPY